MTERAFIDRWRAIRELWRQGYIDEKTKDRWLAALHAAREAMSEEVNF